MYSQVKEPEFSSNPAPREHSGLLVGNWRTHSSYLSSPISYAQSQQESFVAELKTFVRFPSVSSQPKHAHDLKQCASWLANHLASAGMARVYLIPTAGHPIVYADWLGAQSKPVVLIYGHYDVQPADPITDWQSLPFEPSVRGEHLYGRGSSDNKGQMFSHIKALEAYLATGALPVNIKCLFEGEEEIGSPNLGPFIRRNARLLASDVAVISDTRMLAPGRPAITYSLRGGLSLELLMRGPKTDLHSGNFGGAICNPLQALSEVIAKLYDNQGRIAIPNFYDRVRRWPLEERDYMALTGPSNESILKEANAEAGCGEAGFSLYESTTIRPSLSVSGISGGYQGPGVKAIIPSRALAKLNFRLVPDQQPDEIEGLVRKHIAHITPPAIDLKIQTVFKAKPAVISRKHPAMRAAARACQGSFGAPPVFLRSGGTIPVVNKLQEVLGISTILMGFGLPDDRIHAANEKFHLPTFHKSIETCIRLLAEIGAMSKPLLRLEHGSAIAT